MPIGEADVAPHGLAKVKGDLHAGRRHLREILNQGADPLSLLALYRNLVDRALRAVWRHHRLPASTALLAVGGYGRGDLFPSSDVDVLVLLPEEPSAALASELEALIGKLWDLGLELGHSVRTIPQCLDESANDVTVRTALLEARLVIGSRSLFQQFLGVTKASMDLPRFFKSKRLEQEQRHAKYQDTPYSLEPNIKEAPGGLRDLQVIRWIAVAAGFGHTWTALARRGFITVGEANQLSRHLRFLQALRVRLHCAAGRREDRLLFDYQDRLAREMGCTETAHRRASEQLMQRYYRTAKSITQINTILLQNLAAAIFPEMGDAREEINARFNKVRDLLEAKDEALFDRHPPAILESFLILQQRSDLKGMTASTLRAIWRSRRSMDSAFRKDPANRKCFLEILQQPRGLVHELRRMNQYGVLGRYIPAFRRIVGQMQHDLFHVYTVDQHILTVVRNLRRFTMMEFSHEYPLCSRLMSGFERHWLLYVAAIFHDIAKGRGGDHSQLGKADARRFCRAHGLAPDDIDLVEFLVEHHLTMSRVAQKEDISDTGVVENFAAIVQSERRLVALYMLTVADIRGTSPKVWNAWRGKLLEDLFHATHRLLRGERANFDQDIQAKQEEAQRLLLLYALSAGVQDDLWRQLDVAYFLRHAAQDIAWHARLLHYRVNTRSPVVKARLSPIGEGLQILIYAPDQHGLFARICGFFGATGYNIVDARVHTTRHGYALDTFLIMGSGQSPHHREMIAYIEHELSAEISAQSPLTKPVYGRISRQLKHFPIEPEVHIRPDERGLYYLLSVTSGDRPGLLYSIACVLSGYAVSVHTARIVTLGERVEDVFVISGAVLENPREIINLETEILSALRS